MSQSTSGPGAVLRDQIDRNVRLAMILIGVLVVGLGGMALMININGAVIAQGELTASSNIQDVQHPSGGVISEILVRNGSRVRAGDVLVRFDPTTAGAAFSIVNVGVLELQAKLSRLSAERDGLRSISFPQELLGLQVAPEAARIVANEQRLFDLHARAQAGARRQLREQQEQLHEQIAGFQEQIAANRQQTQLIQGELAGIRSLYEQGLAPLSRVSALERGASQLQGGEGQLTATIAQARGRISEINVQIIQLAQQDRAQAASDYNETQARLAELQQRRVASRQDFDRLAVRAPRSGVVDKLVVHTVGGVVAPGTTIMEIVPDDGRLDVRVRVRPQDIDQLRIGQAAGLRFSALNTRSTAELNGQVTIVAADASTEERTGARYFQVTIQVAPYEVARLGPMARQLRPGMPVESFISIRERSIMSFLTRPLTDQFGRAFREE